MAGFLPDTNPHHTAIARASTKQVICDILAQQAVTMRKGVPLLISLMQMAIDKLAKQTAYLQQLCLDKVAEVNRLREVYNGKRAAVTRRISEEGVKELALTMARITSLQEEWLKLDQVLAKVRQQIMVLCMSQSNSYCKCSSAVSYNAG